MRRVRRVLHAGNPREPDYLEAQKAVKEIRSDLARLRHRLEQLQRIETDYAHDSQALRASGAVHCAIVTLADLENGAGSFAERAVGSKRLWEDAAADPEGYVIEEGSSGFAPHSEWKWRDWAWSPGLTKAARLEEIEKASRALLASMDTMGERIGDELVLMDAWLAADVLRKALDR